MYEINGYTYFGCGGSSGSFNYMGINLNIIKNSISIANIIGGNRINFPNLTVTTANSPISVTCIVYLNAGDKIYLAFNYGALDNPTGNVHINTPNNLVENRNFSLRQLSIP